MIEQVGKIVLDLSKYPGEDFYCDGKVEDELLEIVQNHPEKEFGRIIEERKSWAILYHLSYLRENIVDWVPMTKDMKVLEVGSGCGAITGALSRKAGSVTCVDLSKKRSMINAYRHQDCDNVRIHVGNFKDIEPDLDTDFDVICLIGVFEYGQGYIGGETPYEDFLRILQRHLKSDGRMLIAIENKYGLKYFAGCREDHVGTFFEGIENYKQGGGVRTFSRNGLENICKACGVEDYHFYYPYPDYKFMTTIYSDEYLPGKGELSNNIRNFDRDRIQLFDEKIAFDGIVEENLFSVFANSYMLVLGKELPVKYAKYSNDRIPEYQIRTEIRKEQGVREVRKYPMCPEAKGHVLGMQKAYEKLSARYEGSKLLLNKCKVEDAQEEVYACFEYVDGKPLSEILDGCLERGDIDGFYRYFKQYVERIGFGEESGITDFDMIFANILVQEDAWTLIDYEWTLEQQIAAKELAYRAIHCYLLEDEKRHRLNLPKLMKELQITQEEAQQIVERELAFQKGVNGERLSMSELHDLFGAAVVVPQEWGYRNQTESGSNRVQIYQDTGKGYSEEDSYFLPNAYKNDHVIEFELPVGADVKMLRIDPCMNACICKVLSLNFNGQPVPMQKRGVLVVNGKKTHTKDGVSFIFPTEDPNINVGIHKLQPKANNVLSVKLEVAKLPLHFAEDMVNIAKRIF